jgi:hypothetical protein
MKSREGYVLQNILLSSQEYLFAITSKHQTEHLHKQRHQVIHSNILSGLLKRMPKLAPPNLAVASFETAIPINISRV